MNTHADAGRLGYYALLEKYGEKQLNVWRRKGGRRRHRTIDEIEAEAGATRSTKRRGVADHRPS